ncbi:MAG TPA: DUF3465 domain-containing protein [Candidatus Baltobacteraceae bacterium]|jgi:hypothetical protein|nr:DUF3465 domain-containing protein [Candidatus Baltobacteraceae bacterium]
MNLQAAYGSHAPAEVTFQATVASAPTYFYGRHTHCEHEEFVAQTDSGPVDVIDNVGIAPRVPVQPGERIAVRGELVHDPGRLPVVHWTHHDPRQRHQDGFIRLRGRTYA